MMLHILLENGLAEDDHIVFCNTGKEKPQTLDFIQEVSIRWKVPIIWIEATFGPYNLGDKDKRNFDVIMNARNNYDSMKSVEVKSMIDSIGFKIVSYETASRNGEPFTEMIDWIHCGIVPNRQTRFCSKYLKMIPAQRYMESLGYEDGEYDNVLGYRFDEPKRYRKFKDIANFPLVQFGITEQDVFRFWSAQEFDLTLKQYEGNCDLCHLKSLKKLQTIIAENDESIADWWIEQEEKTGSTFLYGMSFKDLVDISKNRRFSKAIDNRTLIEHDLFSISCFCAD